MNTSNETIHTPDSEIMIDVKDLTKAVKKSAAPSLSLKPTRSFNRVKSLRPRTAVGLKRAKLNIGNTEEK